MAKSIALTCILKNEAHNLERFCKSVAGLFNEYHFTDTGSNDGSQNWILNEAYKFLGVDRCNIHLHHFTWIDDFAKARNFALPLIGTDYWMWMDLDDVLKGRENFKAFCRESIGMHDMWYLPYNYALLPDGSPAVSFVRERIFRTSLGYRFKDPIHEGVDVREIPNSVGMCTTAFAIDHLRTHDEMLKDKNDRRNLRILEKNKENLSERLQFYYGKELFDIQDYKGAIAALDKVCKSEKLEKGDRVMAMHFLAVALNEEKEFVKSMQYSVLGINLDPERAEFYCSLADSYMRAGEPIKAIPLLQAAKNCPNRAQHGTRHEFSYSHCYNIYPRCNLSQIYYNFGRFEEALEELHPVFDQLDLQWKEFYKQIEVAKDATTIPKNLIECEDIVFTAPWPTAYPWDEEGYKTKGYGGSETACIEMAKWLKKKTGRCVKIFQVRDKTFVSESGVEYIPSGRLHDYFKKYKPKVHIAWRHCARFTNAPSYVWSHDLFTQHAEGTQNYDKILALSGAHRDMLVGMQGIPQDKILITRNGINPERFKDVVPKVPGKVIWPNSLDRGAEHAIVVMDKVIEKIPHAELHVFYGTDNMKKSGPEMQAKAKMVEDMIASRPWIKYHGNVDQTTLAHHFMESEVWLYTSTFYETQCISAMEAMCSRAWPIVRRFGALKDTLKEAETKGYGNIIDGEMIDHGILDLFAEKVVSAIEEKKWHKMDISPANYSWESVSAEWVQMFSL